MSRIRSSWLLYNPVLRSVTVRSYASTSGGGGDSNDGKKTKSLSGLMSALDSLKVDRALSKPRIGFSAAAEFKKRKSQKVIKPSPKSATLTKPSPKNTTLTKESHEEENKIQQAAQEVAQIFPDQKRTQSDLLGQLMRVKSVQEAPENISDVLSGIKVQKEGPSASTESDRWGTQTTGRSDDTGHEGVQHDQQGSDVLSGIKVQKEGPSASTESDRWGTQTTRSPDDTGHEGVQHDQQGRSHEDMDEIQQEVTPEQKRAKSELLGQLRTVKSVQEDPENISDVLSGIKVQKESPPDDGAFTDRGRRDHQSPGLFDATFGGAEPGRGARTRRGRGGATYEETQYRQLQKGKTLFDLRRLNIFQPPQGIPKDVEIMSEEIPSIWDIEAERVRKELVAEMPRNGFEEMLQLTEEGKLWTYPIDNEKGLEEEQKVPFYEHVFLEDHLEGFPDIPEVMRFMELVLIGLSKNPYLTVEQKREHIDWFRNYFENKMDVLNESTAAVSSTV